MNLTGFFNPKLGVTFQLAASHSNLYASYARANREPSRSDFESNPDIKSEQLNDFEIGWRYNKRSFIKCQLLLSCNTTNS